MKKTTLLLFLSFCFVNVFGQNKKEVFNELVLPKGFPVDSIKNYILKYGTKTEAGKSDTFASAFFDDMMADGSKAYTNDSIPDIARLIVNGIEFQSKKVITKIDNYRIVGVSKDSAYTINSVKRDSVTGSLVYKNIKRKYQRPYARVTQEHPILAHDFFLFKINTLEPERYRCASYSPILDVFNTEDSIGVLLKPRVMIDGRLQAKSFNYDEINLDNIEKIEVFGSSDATNYFGQKVKSGLISYITKGSKFCYDWALANTHVIGEIEDNKGNWKQVVDTLFSNIEQFNEYRKKCLKANGAIYIINDKFETELVNRKTIDMDAITNYRVVNNAKNKRISLSVSDKLASLKTKTTTTENDTIYIETSRYSLTSTSNFSKIVSELKRLRKSTPDPTPLYFVDNQEIDAEKLKQYKPKELEFVESLEGCDAISKYGKRAEYGVVIYRKKK